MTDYASLIDAEAWAFIERTNSFYPPETIDFTVAQQRAIYDRMCLAFHAGYPKGVESGTGDIEGVRCRVYKRAGPNDAADVLYLHGGGFVVGGLESHDDICAELCARTGFNVIAADYRLAPEHIHPAAFDDAMTVFRYLLTRAAPVILCGDSAGGNLAAAVAQATRGTAKPAIGQVLIYPGLGGDMNCGSYIAHANAPMLTVRDLEFYRDIRTGGQGDKNDPTLWPLTDTDYSGLPPTVIITAECDPLSSDGRAYRDRILAAGGQALWIEEPGLVHGYLRARHSVARAGKSFNRIVAAISTLGAGRWPVIDSP